MSVEVAAARPQISENAEREQHARSMRMVRTLGHDALQTQVEVVDTLSAYQETKADWLTQLAEMIKTHPELSSMLEINNVRPMPIKDKKVVDAMGRPMVDIIHDGAGASYKASQQKGTGHMITHYWRDLSDGYDAGRVDHMIAEKTHNTRLVVALEPIEAMERDGVEVWQNRSKGMYYTKGMAFIRLYHIPAADEELPEGVVPLRPADAKEPEAILAGTYSVDLSDKQRWREVLAEIGVDIPPGESTDNWTRYGAELTLSTEEALALPSELRKRYYQKCGAEKQRLSINDFMDKHEEYFDMYFKELYVPLAQAAASGQKNGIMHSIAVNALQEHDHLEPGDRRTLMRIVNGDTFDDSCTRLIESIISFSTVSGLMDKVKAFAYSTSTSAMFFRQEKQLVTPADTRAVLTFIFEGLRTGIERQYVFVACGGVAAFGKNADKQSARQQNADGRNQQAAFGGQGDGAESGDNKSSWEWRLGVCRIKVCPTRKPIKNPKNNVVVLPKKVEIGPCDVCRCCQAIFDEGDDPVDVYTKSNFALVG